MRDDDRHRSADTARMYRPISRAVALILAAHAGQAARAADVAAEPAGSSALQEITVTATRREERLQDVPLSVQALTSETLRQLNVQTLDQFIKYLPNVTQQTYGPTQGEIYMRGLSVGAVGGGGSQGQGTSDTFPMVAVYLDEQSASLPSHNLDVYAADLERIEVLEGPQGTLFGGGALTGVLRYITNKPKIDVTEASVTASYGTTAHGDPNSSATAVLNLPLIEGHLALRGVVYSDRQGGYINNVPSTFTRAGTDEGFTLYNGGVVPANSPVINNYSIAADHINPVTYTGTRIEALYKVNDGWDVLLTESYQNVDAQGVFYQMPFASEGVTFNSLGAPLGSKPLPPLSVNLFNPSYDKDRFENTALVVNGKVGDLKAVYSAAYLVRNVEQVQDYTNYARGVGGSYYQCVGLSAGTTAGQCFTPSTIWRETVRNTHQSHELRFSTPDDWRVRAIAGAYWEKYNILDQAQWTYVTVPVCSPTGANTNCFLPTQPWPGSPAFTPRPASGFYDDIERGYKQLAEFASLDVDIVPRVLTITGGLRHFKYDSNETGGSVGSSGCLQYSPTSYFGPCQTPFGTNFALRPNQVTNSGNRARGNLTWHATPDAMLYYTWSQGFRAGMFNRSTACHLPGPDGKPQYCIPPTAVPDNVTNNEVGWKTEWVGHRVQFNGALYQEIWGNSQTQFFDPQQGLGNNVFAVNGPNYRVRGVETLVLARVTQGLTLQVAASWNSSEQTNSPFLIDNNPQSSNFRKPITSIPNPYGSAGSSTAYSPPFSINGRARYDWSMGEYNLFVQAGGMHQAHTISNTGNVPAYDMPPLTSYDAAAGVATGPWDVQLYGQNITNVNTSLSTGSAQFVVTEVPLRPRVLGIRLGYRYSGK